MFLLNSHITLLSINHSIMLSKIKFYSIMIRLRDVYYLFFIFFILCLRL